MLETEKDDARYIERSFHCCIKRDELCDPNLQGSEQIDRRKTDDRYDSKHGELNCVL